MNKKKLAITIFIISLILITIGIILNRGYGSKTKKNNTNTDNKKIIYKQPDASEIELKEITTSDKAITIKKTTGRYLYETFAVSLTITSTQNYDELYLIFKFSFEDSNDEIPIVLYINNIEAGQEYKTEIQHQKDLTKAKSWTVEKATKEEVIEVGY